ncbi:hypothetical protein Tco_0512396 [Tanacetum coccineum]
MGAIHDKLNDDWFNGTSEDEDDLEGILDYLEPRSYYGLIDLYHEAYNKRKCILLGLTYKEPPSILIEKVKVTRYTIGPEEIYTKVKVLGIDEMPRTRDNVAAIKASKEMEFKVKIPVLHITDHITKPTITITRALHITKCLQIILILLQDDDNLMRWKEQLLGAVNINAAAGTNGAVTRTHAGSSRGTKAMTFLDKHFIDKEDQSRL